MMVNIQIFSLQKARGDNVDDEEEEFEWVYSTVVRVSLLVCALACLVLCSLLNCYIEGRREESRERKRYE